MFRSVFVFRIVKFASVEVEHEVTLLEPGKDAGKRSFVLELLQVPFHYCRHLQARI